MGRRHRPFYRINAVDSRTPRDGRILEKLGHFDPIVADVDKQLVLNTERVQFWLDQGAIPSDTVTDLLARKGIKTKAGEEKKARREKAKAIARKKGKLFNTADRVAAEKAEEAQATAAAEAEAVATAQADEAAKAADAKVAEAAKAEEEKAAAAAKAAEEAEAAKAAEADTTETTEATEGSEAGE